MAHKDGSEDKEIMDAKVFAAIGYWTFLCILPLILKKDNKFALYHGKQGLVLFIFLVFGFMFNILPFLGNLIYKLILFAYMLFSLWGTIQALSGKYARIPFVSEIAEKISL